MKTYASLLNSIASMGKIDYIGSTVLGYGIPLVRIGKEVPRTLIIGSVHAREHITTLMLNEVVKLNTDCSFDYIPMLNIDGVSLSIDGINFITDEERKKNLYKYNNYNMDFSMWKANANGVDLNVNFDAEWGEGKNNITYPAPENYIGKTPNSEPETQAVVNLLKKNNYAMVACYHSKGEVVYWGFESNFRYYKEAKAIAEGLNYSLERSDGSAGGIKDYYCTKYKGLGITIEIGKDSFSHPYPESELPNLISKHKDSLRLICQTGGKIAREIYGGSS